MTRPKIGFALGSGSARGWAHIGIIEALAEAGIEPDIVCGTSIGALLTVRDAESVRKIEDEIELSRRLSAIGRLTSGVAHEVKNPINAIVIHLAILRERILQLDPESQRHMDIINSEIHRLDRVVKTLVDFSRPAELRLSALDLRGLASEVAELAAPEADSHHVEIFQDFSLRPITVRVDADLIKQAILNVVLNGVQAMPAGGTLLLRAYTSAQAAVLEVQDSGEGVPPEIRDKIFNLYFTTKPSGSGIGLAFSYRAMQLHNGALELDDRERRGTTFRFLLPLYTQAAEAGANTEAGSGNIHRSSAAEASEPEHSRRSRAALEPPH